MNTKLYAVFMQSDDMEPVLIGIATTRNAAIAMAEISNKEFEGQFYYSLSSCPANTIHMNDRTFLFDKYGKLQDTKIIVKDNSLFNIWESEELDFSEFERDE